MDNVTPSRVRNNLDYQPLHSPAENTEVSSKSFSNYNECEKNKSSESASSDDSINFEPPDELLMDKIIQQVEFLFSDANILKDKFLLKHIRRNKEGYVSLKLVSSLRKVKALSRHWKVVAYSLQKSQKLQLNDDMTKIKRRVPVPELKILDPSRTVLVFHYLPSCWSEESLKRQLNKLGSVMFLKMVHSETDLWYISVQKTLSFYAKITTLPFAVVIFETPDEAANAVLQTSHPSSIILKIVPVLEDGIFEETTPRNKNKYSIRSTDFPVQDGSDRKITRFGQIYAKNEYCLGMSNFFPSITAKKFMLYNNHKNFYQSQIDRLSQCMMQEKQLLACSYKNDQPINTAGYQRKSYFTKHKEAPMNILRQPKGPDSTIGFRKLREQKNSPGNSV